MTQSIAILGRQPPLGLAELESLYGAVVQPIGDHAALIDIEPAQIDFSRLGGTMKFGKLLTTLDTTDWSKIAEFLCTAVPEHAGSLPEGKLRLGMSVYGLRVSSKQLLQTGLELKKLVRASGRPVRIVPNKEPTLNSAQVLHNQLTQAFGWELLFIRDGNRTLCAQSIAVQDIDAYAARDQARPKRDARVGMLPPKLAQIIVNLAVGDDSRSQIVDSRSTEQAASCGVRPSYDKVVLDPFCGTGVVLQEALLMGYNAYGSDLEPRMVDFTGHNLMWLNEQFPQVQPLAFAVKVADATTYIWDNFDVIACETYLGRPFSALPAPNVLDEVMQDVDTIHRKFLRNVAHQTAPGFRLCIAVPAWKTPHGFKHLKMLDSLADLGYTRRVFTHVDNRDMVYHRPEQIVARELVVLTRK